MAPKSAPTAAPIPIASDRFNLVADLSSGFAGVATVGGVGLDVGRHIGAGVGAGVGVGVGVCPADPDPTDPDPDSIDPDGNSIAPASITITEPSMYELSFLRMLNILIFPDMEWRC
jgi:hypothetical protein